ncbi:prepilin-type N-terminal cleavage/methylation domain-containing protein [Pullulanibacillus pueri]|uniref:Prepilin-type N-terminal cleavage/methylation domain-containing protein n=1 Tax=Pullulanibacillus pueri TaxID=1437324 RepID=A0A8J2ZY19_9BACL|nr:type II secretion system protein [Pullulanibacillus pueri]MBM7680512.1 prepilin-type N-terminal cleavage/methylation domain-containing protein [Pullulanibacillus pueri]GGH86076.1 hypothetical protein GCM10007096_32940 [Pullulanibacillus pueri]
MGKLKAARSAIKNTRGLTLVEVLAVIVLLTLVFLLANALHLFGLKQYDIQTEEIKNQSQVRLAMIELTKEIRSADRVEVSETHDRFTITHSDQIKTFTLNKQDHTIDKNGHPLIEGISTFSIIQSGSKITLTLKSLPNKSGESVERSTDFYIRE